MWNTPDGGPRLAEILAVLITFYSMRIGHFLLKSFSTGFGGTNFWKYDYQYQN